MPNRHRRRFPALAQNARAASQPCPTHTNPLVEWFDDQVWSSEHVYLAKLADEAATLARALRPEVAAPTAPSALMAYLMLTDYALAKGLRLGEVVMLLDQPIALANEALGLLARRRPLSDGVNDPRRGLWPV